MKKITGILVLLAVLLLVSHPAWSQCAMCTAVADEAQANGSSAADGVNKGVLFLFVSPYLIVGTIGFLWWRARRRAQQEVVLADGQI